MFTIYSQATRKFNIPATVKFDEIKALMDAEGEKDIKKAEELKAQILKKLE